MFVKINADLVSTRDLFKKTLRNLTKPKLWNSIFVFLITPLVEPVLLCPAGQALLGGIDLLMAFFLFSLHIKQ